MLMLVVNYLMSMILSQQTKMMSSCVSDTSPSTWVVVWSSAGTSVCVVAELMDMETVLARSQALDLSAQLDSIPFLIKIQACSVSNTSLYHLQFAQSSA